MIYGPYAVIGLLDDDAFHVVPSKNLQVLILRLRVDEVMGDIRPVTVLSVNEPKQGSSISVKHSACKRGADSLRPPL